MTDVWKKIPAAERGRGCSCYFMKEQAENDKRCRGGLGSQNGICKVFLVNSGAEDVAGEAERFCLTLWIRM